MKMQLKRDFFKTTLVERVCIILRLLRKLFLHIPKNSENSITYTVV